MRVRARHKYFAVLPGAVQALALLGSWDVAIYHYHVASVSRRAGQSAVRTAAYITGTRAVDERTGRTANYARKAREILANGAAGPVDWQQTERAEKRKDAKVARHAIVALPFELPLAAQITLVARYAAWLRAQHGFAIQWAVHGAPGDERNIHAHLLMTTRVVAENGVHGPKVRALDRSRTSKAIVTHWREVWAESINAALERHRHQARVNCRSLAARGIPRPPRQHLGPEQSHQQRRGYRTAGGRVNATINLIAQINAELQTLNNEYDQLERTHANHRTRTATARQRPHPLSRGHLSRGGQRAERTQHPTL